MDAPNNHITKVDGEPPGGVHALVDGSIVFTAEALKSLTQQSFHLGGQLINGVVSSFLSWTFEPGYAAARRARVAVARVAGDLAKHSQGTFDGITNLLQDFEARIEPHEEPSVSNSHATDQHDVLVGLNGNLLESSGETIAHQSQPTAANRWSPGVVEEWKLAALVEIDSCTTSCRRKVSSAFQVLPSCGGCCRRKLIRVPQARPLGRRPIKLASVATDLIAPPAGLLSNTARGARARRFSDPVKQKSRKRPTSLPPDVAKIRASPERRDIPVHPSQRPPNVSSAYWPLPKLSSLSAACHIIDSVCGYPAQTYAVRTVDGYILTLVRIPRIESRKVVFFQHGLLDSASAWVSTGNVHSLASRAFQAGYDVFLGNMRGSNDAMGINGFGANPADYGEQLQKEDSSQEGVAGFVARAKSSVNAAVVPGSEDTNTVPPSPLRGHSARARSLSGSGMDAAPASRRATAAFIGSDADGIPVHETLHPRQSEYWNYSVDDHALDVMAFFRQIRIIKAVEAAERKRLIREAESRRSTGAMEAEDARVRESNFSQAVAEGLHDANSVRGRHGSAIDDSINLAGSAREETLSCRSEASSLLSAPVARPHDFMHCVQAETQEEPVGSKMVDATSTAADDCKIVAVGHSMGGCVLLLYILISNALRRPHWLSKMVLLSPAGMHRHLPWPFRVLLFSLYELGIMSIQRPFPMRSSSLQRFAARLLQDAKRMQATGDLMAVLGSYFFGGERHKFVFRFVSFTDYPVGGSNFKVLRHGIQTMKSRDFHCYDYGKAENLRRYAQATAPSYRRDYSLFDAPIHIIAGGRDFLVPAANLEEQFALINMIHPGLATMREFDKAGHLDFTLTLADEIISHVLDEIELGFQQPLQPGSPLHGSGSRLPNVVHAPNVDGLATGGSPKDLPAARPQQVVPLPPSISGDGVLMQELGQIAEIAKQRARRIQVTAKWRPAREQLMLYPWLGAFSKLEAALDGFDQEAMEMGLTGQSKAPSAGW